MPGEADFRVMEYERYATRIQTKEGDEPEATQKSQSTLGLIENPTRTTWPNWLWRIGMRYRR